MDLPTIDWAKISLLAICQTDGVEVFARRIPIPNVDLLLLQRKSSQHLAWKICALEPMLRA